MIYKNINLIKEKQFDNKYIIAIDFGTRNFGFAVSDKSQTIANPWLNYHRAGLAEDLQQIEILCKAKDTNLILLGLPRNLDNSMLKTTQQVKSFANILVKELDMDVFFWDERYSSKAAANVTQHKEFGGKKSDKIAATIILQTFLDFKNN